jgi:protein-S-isoprenylcysteine O-methyltransferase Ste14
LTDRTSASRGRSRLPDLGPRGEGWVVGQVFLLGLLIVQSLPGLPLIAPVALIGWLRFLLGLVVMATGGWLVFRGFTDLGGSLTPLPRPRADGRLVEAGIYRRLRHPIYAGLICAGIGWSVLTASLPAALVALVLAVFLDLKARREEAWLVDRYKDYAAYQQRSHRFVPGIY